MYQNVKKSRINRKQQMIYVMGNKCQLCGYDKCISALEFHHINPEEKVFTFNQKENYAWEKQKEELKKCILLCANCHREVHQEMHKNIILKSSFDESKAEEISQHIEELKHHKIYYCKNCGTIIATNTNYCIECSSIKRRIVERPTREELKKIIKELSFVEIGRRYNVTDNAIRKWCKTYNLPSTKKEIKALTDEEWLKI